MISSQTLPSKESKGSNVGLSNVSPSIFSGAFIASAPDLDSSQLLVSPPLSFPLQCRPVIPANRTLLLIVDRCVPEAEKSDGSFWQSFR